MIINPKNDNILIELKPEPAENKTQSGIILSKSQMPEKQDRGKVVAVGQGKLAMDGTRISPCVEIGETVMFNKFAGTEIETDNGKFILIKENDILATIQQ